MAQGEFVDWVPTVDPATEPPANALAWVAGELGGEVVEVERLVGGLSSAVHRLTLSDQRRVVLRRHTQVEWLQREPHIPFAEARNLQAIATAELPFATPVLLASDLTGEHCDAPAIVMSEVAGRPDIDPSVPLPWVEKLAEAIAAINAVEPPADLRRYERWDHPDRPLPTWTKRPELWHEAIAQAAPELPQHPDAFLHRDFHPNNVHWQGDGRAQQVCAVVDWLGACVGPIAGDLAHCRWNIAVLINAEAADHFLAHYRLVTGYSEDPIAYDLSIVLEAPVGPFPTGAWNALGRADLTPESVAGRIDAWLAHLLGQ